MNQSRVLKAADQSGQSVVPIRTMRAGPEKPVRALAFSPDGQLLVSGGDDGAIRLWATAVGECITAYTENTWGVVAVSISPDGKLVAATAVGIKPPVKEQTRAVLRNLTTRYWTKLPIQGELSSSNPVFCRDSSLVAVKCGSVHLFDTRTATLVQEVPVITRGYAISFTPDDRHLVIGEASGNLSVWGKDAQECSRRFKGHRQLVSCLAFSPDGKYLLSASVTKLPRGRLEHLLGSPPDHTLRFWNFKTGKEVRTAVKVGESTTYLTVLSDEITWVAFDAEEGTLYHGKIKSKQNTVAWKPPGEEPAHAAVTPDGALLATGHADGQIKLWERMLG